jgi:hypothetical protein
MSIVAEIMTSPGFGEVCFLVALILFIIEFVIRLVRPGPEKWPYDSLLMVAGFAFIALGWLALITGD